jgi:hypothetical protein
MLICRYKEQEEVLEQSREVVAKLEELARYSNIKFVDI